LDGIYRNRDLTQILQHYPKVQKTRFFLPLKIGFLISGVRSEFKNQDNFDKIYPVLDPEYKQQL